MEQQTGHDERHFQHSDQVWADYPTLVAGVIYADGLTSHPPVAPPIARFTTAAEARLAAAGTEAEFPEIQAWRRAFSQQGLKPTQYRCASESLLRRLRRSGSLPQIHPLIDLCNAVSVAYAIPVAALDATKITNRLEVRYARGDERYQSFSGEQEHPAPGEVVFADADGRAHARRWTNRQSGYSAVQDSTATVLIVAEALHATAAADVPKLITQLAGALAEAWPVTPVTAGLSRAAPRFDY